MEIEHKYRLTRHGMLTLTRKMRDDGGEKPQVYQRDTYFLPAEPGYIYRLRDESGGRGRVAPSWPAPRALDRRVLELVYGR